jgi:ABC-type lipoprotein release transport system permease subunit
MKTLNLILFWLRVAFLFLVRSMRSTGILSLMLVTAVAALIFLSALAVGVNDAMIRNSVSLYTGHISGFNIPEDTPKNKLAVPGVAAVLKRYNIPGNLIHGHKSQDILLTEIEPDAERRITAISKKIVDGGYLPNAKGQILIGQSVAKKLGVTSGDNIQFKLLSGAQSITFQVAGIYRTGIDQIDGEIAFCPHGSVASPPTGWSAAVFLREGVEPESIIPAYRDVLPGTAEFKSWKTLMPDLKQLIDLNYVSMSIVILLVFGVVSLGIACAFVIVILKTIREYGILKAMGVTSGETMLLIIFEVVLMNLLASTLGILLGIALSLLVRETGIDLTAFTSHNRYFAVSGIIYPRLTPFAWAVPPTLAFLFSLVASIWPAVLVARRRAAEVLRIV